MPMLAQIVPVYAIILRRTNVKNCFGIIYANIGIFLFNMVRIRNNNATGYAKKIYKIAPRTSGISLFMPTLSNPYSKNQILFSTLAKIVLRSGLMF
jgi:hypothetical protein